MASSSQAHTQKTPKEIPQLDPLSRTSPPGDATCDWRGQAKLNWSQAFSILQTYKCPVCRSVKHSLVDCPVAQKRGYKVTYSASENTGAGYRPPPCHGAGGAPRHSNTARKGRAEAAPGPSPAPAPKLAPIRPEGPLPAKLGKVVGFKVETPSISLSKASNSPSASDDDHFLDWGGTNEDVIHALERTQSQKTKATKAHASLKPSQSPPVSSHASARTVQCHNKFLQRLSAMDTAGTTGSDAWVPTKLSSARSGSSGNNKQQVTSYLCVDSGASHDLFPNRSYFIDYNAISDAGHYVVVANESHIPIHGIGTVRCQIDGHEVLIRKVYHVPLLNSPLFSICTHRRRGAGCSLVADDSGCWLTLPSFIMKIDDSDDFLLPIAPSNPTAPLEYSKPLLIQHTLTAARRAATTKTISCRRSRVAIAASHLLPAQSPEKRAELPIIPTNYIPESASAKRHRHSSYDLHRHFGCRKLNYDILPHLGTGLHVTQTKEPPLTIGGMSTMKRGARGGPVTRPPRALHTVGIDIGYGNGKSPGYQCCLFMVDLATRYTWTYGLANLSGDTIIDALWRFFVNAGGFPRRLHCDFDRRFLAGSAG
jgi:hypothetical protein